MERRSLYFESYEEVVREIESLEKNGYSMVGRWTLAQACAHLDYYYKGSLDGFADMLPWIVRLLVGKPLLWWVLRQDTMREGGATAPKSVPKAEDDTKESITTAKDNLKRLTTATALHPSGLFGELTVEQWRTLHLKHSAHHLGFLIPKR